MNEPRALAVCLLSCCALVAQGAGDPQHFTAAFPDNKITLDIAGLPPLAKVDTKDKLIRGFWTGKTATGDGVEVSFWVLGADLVIGHEPNDLIWQFLAVRPGFLLKKRTLVGGPYGYAPCLALGVAQKGDQDQLLFGCGVFESGGYCLEVAWHGPLAEADCGRLLAAIEKGIRWDGKPWDARWSEAEVNARWQKATGREKPGKVIRTSHYVVLTDSRAGQTFAEKVEEHYKAIRTQYPFEEHAGERLMIVFVLRDQAEYGDFCARTGNAALGTTSRGHAYGDYYATWYESPGEKVHIHEMTHQIFRNRLRLSGGGSWFQEGVAELMATTPGQRRSFAGQAALRGTYLPFKDFFVKDDLLGEQITLSGDSVGERLYVQAASVMEFLRDSPFGKKGFPNFLKTVGSVQRDDLAGIEAALRAVYGVGVAGLEKEYVEWWKTKA